MKRKKRIALLKKYSWLLLSLSFSLYSLLLIYRSSFVFGNERYFVLFDDEMISMRYAYNLAHGFGMVWNQTGERVEGITNPLWTSMMAVFHLFPLQLRLMSLPIQIVSCICLLLNLFFVKKLASFLSKDSYFVWFMSVFFTAFYFPLNNWGTFLGTEVSILTLLTTAVTYLVIRFLQSRTFSVWIFVLLGIGSFIRLDFLVPSVVLLLSLFIFSPKTGQKLLARGLPVFIVLVGMQFLIRDWYYGNLLPNTYYLKMTGYPFLQRVVRGIYVTIQEIHPLLFVIPFITYFFTRQKYLLVILSVISAQFLYSAYVGGDAWEQFGGANRYAAIVMPLYFILLAYSIGALHTFVKKTTTGKIFRRYLTLQFAIVVFLFILFNSASDNMLLYLTLLKQPSTVSQNHNQLLMSQKLVSITKQHATIGIVQAGVIPYFSPDRTYIDLLGKSEKTIARGASGVPETEGGLRKYLMFIPGHTKWNYPYVVRQYHPDVIGELYPPSEIIHLQKEYLTYTTPDGYVFYVNKQGKGLRPHVLEKAK